MHTDMNLPSPLPKRTFRGAFVALLMALAPPVAALAPPAAAHADETRTTLYVTVSAITNSHGHVRLAVCTRQTFLGHNCPYLASAPARVGTVSISVEGVPPGEYALQVFHDEDDSGQIKRSLFGIPEEGFGFSNDPPIRIGAPRFSDASFQVTPGGAQVSLRLRHFD
jgi:uncharacterized protein (DUF2141 family)